MTRNALIIAIYSIGVALLCLLVYSFERTSYLFGLFETWAPAALAAALVVEVSAVALLIGAGALAHLDEQAQQWANRALVAVLSVSALANLTAGYLRGGRETLALFGASADGWWPYPFAAYAVAAALWFVTNLAVPGLILCLSKLLERLIAALVSGSYDPFRNEVERLHGHLVGRQRWSRRLVGMLQQSRLQLAVYEAEVQSLRGQLAEASRARLDAESRLVDTSRELEAARGDVTGLRSRLVASETAHAASEQDLVALHARLVGVVPGRATIMEYVRGQIAQHRPLEEIARKLDIPPSTLRTWLQRPMIEQNGHQIEI